MASPAQPHVHDHDHATPAAHRASVDAALEALRSDGGRITSGRRAIVAAVLAGKDHHVTADELAADLQRDNPSMAVSTIYRTLEALEELDIVARVDLGQGRAVYHPVDHVHHHLVCSVCGRVEEVDEAAIAPLAADLEGRTGFVLASERLTLQGTCRTCRT